MNITQFLEQMKIAPELTDITSGAGIFRQEMQNGLAGKPSSLQMIPAYIGSDFSVEPGDYVIAIDAGGTNLRISLIQFDENTFPQIKEIRRHPMPGVQKPVTCEEFFDFLAVELGDFLNKASRIGFCFSYAVEIQPSGDGRILALSKEVTIKGCEGKLIGEELARALARNNLPGFDQITILNDTTAALIGGQCLCRDKVYSDYIGYILGTGTNICYYETNKNITKNSYLSQMEGRSLVNTESGNYDKQVHGELDLEFWAETQHPEKQHMEKMISGYYLGSLLEKYLKKAAGCGVFSASAAEQIHALHGLDTLSFSRYMDGQLDENPLAFLRDFDGQDSVVAERLMDALLARAARLVCCSILGCLTQTGSGKEKEHPVLVLMEGSTFAHFRPLKEKILEYIAADIEEKNGYYIDIQQLENAVTFGTAFAGARK